MPALDAVHHIVELQAQVPVVPYTALWNRLVGFEPAELSRLTEDRAVARVPLMRSTIHLVTADDALSMRPLLQPVLARTFAGTVWSKQLGQYDVADILDHGRALLGAADGALTRAQLGRLQAQRWTGVEAEPLGMSNDVPAAGAAADTARCLGTQRPGGLGTGRVLARGRPVRRCDGGAARAPLPCCVRSGQRHGHPGVVRVDQTPRGDRRPRQSVETLSH